MKKILILMVGILLILPLVVAQEIEENPGITPDMPILYGLDRAMERIRMILTLRNESKVNYGLQNALERLAEVKAMQEKNRMRALEKARKGYEDIMDEIENKTVSENMKTKIRAESQKHTDILQELLIKIPEQNREGIRNAIEKSKRVKEKFRWK